MTTVRPITADDYEEWRPLWEDYLSFYRYEGEAPEVFPRLIASESVAGLLAFAADSKGVGSADRAIGLAHLVFHDSTWSDQPSCYLNDLFVARAGRGSGAGRSLIEATYAAARSRGCAKVYWHTQEYNFAARSLYDTVGQLTSFRVYQHTL